MSTLLRCHGLVVVACALFTAALGLAQGGALTPFAGKSCTIVLQDSVGTRVLGRFGKEIAWEVTDSGAVRITAWDGEAIFTYKTADGALRSLRNQDVRDRVVELRQDFTGRLLGDVTKLPSESGDGTPPPSSAVAQAPHAGSAATTATKEQPSALPQVDIPSELGNGSADLRLADCKVRVVSAMCFKQFFARESAEPGASTITYKTATDDYYLVLTVGITRPRDGVLRLSPTQLVILVDAPDWNYISRPWAVERLGSSVPTTGVPGVMLGAFGKTPVATEDRSPASATTYLRCAYGPFRGPTTSVSLVIEDSSRVLQLRSPSGGTAVGATRPGTTSAGGPSTTAENRDTFTGTVKSVRVSAPLRVGDFLQADVGAPDKVHFQLNEVPDREFVVGYEQAVKWGLVEEIDMGGGAKMAKTRGEGWMVRVVVTRGTNAVTGLEKL